MNLCFQSKCKNVSRNLRMYTTYVFSFSYLRKSSSKTYILYYLHTSELPFKINLRFSYFRSFYDTTRNSRENLPLKFLCIFWMCIQIQSINNISISDILKKIEKQNNKENNKEYQKDFDIKNYDYNSLLYKNYWI